jgi:hypothetical protein
MRKRLIKQLDYKERQWLYKAIFQMIMADKSVAREEIDELKYTLRQITGKDLKDYSGIVKSAEFLIPLKPLKNITFDHAFIMLMEIARVSAIDSDFVLAEEELITEILSLLDFEESAVNKVIQWTKKLAVINKEEEDLKKELENSYRDNNAPISQLPE